ncbi:MAG: hypothetical protein KIT72_11075 [Polyangiaceae bacterium]|nr:hypothetical protein [Polyangiaceae bacterium]MCW5790953.1 hypothetical protein [Polyangiaceae bacterium]
MESGPPPRTGLVSGPEIRVSHSVAGRETLAAIAEELMQPVPSGAARGSLPEIEITHGTAGRETLAAIASELVQTSSGPRFESMPDIEISQGRAGHETMAAIAAEVQREASRIAISQGWKDDSEEAGSAVRPRMSTLGFEDRPKQRTSTPDVITRDVTGVGRNTLRELETDAVAEALGRGLRITEPPRADQRLEVFEMVTFVVRATDAGRLSSVRGRRDFVAEKLMHRLPITTPEQIERVDVTPWTEKGTLILRVWCQVATG